jgi:hypothetical protein
VKRLALWFLRHVPDRYPAPQMPIRWRWTPLRMKRWEWEKALLFEGRHVIVGPIGFCMFCGRDDTRDEVTCTGRVEPVDWDAIVERAHR